ncbi:hypothetical protein [Chitinophaga defluvii]|uniref:Uncharacterized protein n=1 Tax=Chitinophaga defluvii TaxID=3163343 RepID=A0ABV2TAB8_9BACT
MNSFIISSNWQKSGIKDPDKMISKVFTHYPLSSYRMFIRDVVQYVLSFQKIDYHKKDLLHLFKMQEAAIIAASLINMEARKNPVIIKAVHLTQLDHFTIQEEEQAQWDDIPRTLSSDEVLNPYITLKYFFKHHNLKTWQMILKKLFHYSKTKKFAFQDSLLINPIATCDYLLKLTEALHLIYVREIFPAANIRPQCRAILKTEQPPVTKPDTFI